jgi:hypothetical protein
MKSGLSKKKPIYGKTPGLSKKNPEYRKNRINEENPDYGRELRNKNSHLPKQQQIDR